MKTVKIIEPSEKATPNNWEILNYEKTPQKVTELSEKFTNIRIIIKLKNKKRKIKLFMNTRILSMNKKVFLPLFLHRIFNGTFK